MILTRIPDEKKEKGYTVLSNQFLRDKELSLKGKGLLSAIFSLPEDWDFSIAGLAAICRENKTAIQTALKELEERGYVRKKQTHNTNGTFSESEYIFYEDPQQSTDNRKTVDSPYADLPSTGNPSTGNPSTGNQPQINTNKKNTNKKNKPPKAPPRGQCESELMPKFKPEDFEIIWQLYPRGENRSKAVREWDKLKPDEALLEQMRATLGYQIASDAWRREIGIPYLSAWLRDKRWTDKQKKHAADGSNWADDPELVP